MEFEIKRVLEICDEFLKVPSTTCYEKPFLNFLKSKIEHLGYQTTLNSGYLHIKIKNPNCLFSAHIDRQGLIKNEKNQVEYAAFFEKRIRKQKFTREINGKIEKDFSEELNLKNYGFKFNLRQNVMTVLRERDNSLIKFELIGSESFFEKVALRYIRESFSSYDENTGEIFHNFVTNRYDIDLKNQRITYTISKDLEKRDKFFMLNSKIYKSKVEFASFSAQIDNVISVAVLFYLLEKKEISGDVIFTTKEEIGESYIGILDFYKNLEINNKKNCNNKTKNLPLITLDTSPYLSFKGFPEGFLTLRKGDERSGFDLNLLKVIKSNLEKNKIDFDIKPSFIGKTELGKVYLESKGRVSGCTLQLPTTNYHTTYETAQILGLKNYLKVIKTLF